jgi:hypothetical protein
VSTRFAEANHSLKGKKLKADTYNIRKNWKNISGIARFRQGKYYIICKKFIRVHKNYKEPPL